MTHYKCRGVLISLSQAMSPQADKPLKSVTHGQCDARLTVTFQPYGITAPWPLSHYTAWWQRHTCVNNLPKVVARKRNAGDWTFQSHVQRSNHYITMPHTIRGPSYKVSYDLSQDYRTFIVRPTYCMIYNVLRFLLRISQASLRTLRQTILQFYEWTVPKKSVAFFVRCLIN